MVDINKTLGELLSDERIAPVADDAIANWDLPHQEIWNKSLLTLRQEGFGGEIARGLDRLYAAAETGEWYYKVYSDEECLEAPHRGEVSLVWLPSGDPGAANRPFILLVPGGGFVNVWNLTEGWPVADRFNDLGYHVFELTYQVRGDDHVLARNMEDFAAALRFIRANAARFGVSPDAYIPCGFSAGGYLVCLWNVREMGYGRFGLPRPSAVFPIYPLVSWKRLIRYGGDDAQLAARLFGHGFEQAANSPYEVPDHVEGFAPCALFAAAQDDLVSPENSRMLARALEAKNIPCRLEIGPEGGHGFADGTGMCMAGWPERAIRWYEQIAGQR